MVIKALIIEDELRGRKALKNLLARFCANVEIVGEAITVKQSIELIESTKPDLVFLDIELPHQNGFALLEHFPNPDFSIIFTTAYDDYAIQAFRISAVDYLLKPIDFRLLQKAVEKVRNKVNNLQRSESLELLLDNVKKVPFNKIALPISNGLAFIELKDLIFCKADRNYTYFHLIEGKKYVVSKPLKYYEAILNNAHFFRINRSVIINLHMLKSYSRTKSGEIVLTSEDVFTISENKKQQFLEQINYR